VQPNVEGSTTEVEYMAVAAATTEGLWLRTLLSELGMGVRWIVVGLFQVNDVFLCIPLDCVKAIAARKSPAICCLLQHVDPMHSLQCFRIRGCLSQITCA
jgi:hypothetical protein